MQKLQLFIENKRVDLFKDETVSLTQTIQNVKDIGKIFTEFTQTFSLPASKKNNKIFKHYYNFNINNGYDARKKQNAFLELNGLLFKTGKIKLEGVNLKNNLAHTYRITFFGNTVDLKDIIGDDQLSALPSLGDYNQLYTYAKVKEAMQGYAAGSNDNIIVPLITHTDRMFYSSLDSDDTNIYTNVYYNANIAFTNNGINWNQYKYAIRVQAIIDAIETEYTKLNGYSANIQFSNNFFNDSSNARFNNLFLWLHRKKGGVETPAEGGYTYSQVTNIDGNTTTGLTQPITGSSSNGILTIIPGEESATWLLKLTLIPTSNVIDYDVRITNTTGGVWNFTGLTGNQSPSVFQDFTDETENLVDTYTLSIGSSTPLTFAAEGIKWEIEQTDREGSGTISGGQLRFNNANFVTTPDLEFNIIEQIPKMTIIQLLTGLFQMFNLTAYVNNLGTIVVQTLDSYYTESSLTYNIDQYLDVKTSIVDVALPFKEVNFSYKGLGTLLAKQFEQINNSGWGSLSYTLGNEIYDAPEKSYSIQLPFEHLLYERLYDPQGQALTTIQYGFFVDDNQESYYGEPLLFYPIIKVNGTDLALRNTNPVQQQSIDDYWIPSNSVSTDSSTSKINIHFNPMQNEYSGNGFTDTLFETEYKTYIQDVFNNSRRLTKVTAYLPLKIFRDLKLNDLIQLGQSKYRINSLTTNLTTGKTKFELLNKVI